ncbi:uncharacterized protein DEA37_0007011 [Paragonimus westermani]|uniref:Uncharacterized protein n=1 Tax=Paragonimus westermani TaxID=34504 RepID=A0A5J4NTF4_9TREM|nr:uncharacterized protein DEA37_0007011 [Paragonimus westermani]
MEDCLRHSQDAGVDLLPGERLTDLDYADDKVLLFDNFQSAQKTTEEIPISPSLEVGLRSSRSLQQLHPSDPIHSHLPLSSSTGASHISLNLSEFPNGTPVTSSHVDHKLSAACPITSSSKTPPDSGLHLVIPESQHSTSDDRLTEHGSPRSETVNSPPDPILSLQLQLVPRLVPEWDFIDGLMRLARRLVPISPKEQRSNLIYSLRACIVSTCFVLALSFATDS